MVTQECLSQELSESSHIPHVSVTLDTRRAPKGCILNQRILNKRSCLQSRKTAGGLSSWQKILYSYVMASRETFCFPLFPKISLFLSRFEGKQNCFPRNQKFSVLFYSWSLMLSNKPNKERRSQSFLWLVGELAEIA